MNNHINIINDLMKRVYSVIHFFDNPSDAEILETMLSDLDDEENLCIADYDNGEINDEELKTRIRDCENLKAAITEVLDSMNE